MARKRQIDPDIWKSEQVVRLPLAARLLFIGMISIADDEGRLKASPLSLKMSIFPADPCGTNDVMAWRDNVVSEGLAIKYEMNGCEYAYLPNFKKYQYMTKIFPSKLPPPPEVNDRLITDTKPVNDKLSTRRRQLYGSGSGNGVGDGVGVGVVYRDNNIITELKKLRNWGGTNPEDDKKWLDEFLAEFPSFDEGHIKACRDYHSGRAVHEDAGVWKNRLRNWMKKEKEYLEKNSGKNHGTFKRNPRAVRKAHEFTQPEDL